MCSCLHIALDLILFFLRNMFRLFKYAFVQVFVPFSKKKNVLKHIKILHKDQNKLLMDKY